MLKIKSVLFLWDRFNSWRSKRHNKEKLLELLKDERFLQGRSLEELTLKTGMSEAACRTLLREIRAEGIRLNDGREGWRLTERP